MIRRLVLVAAVIAFVRTCEAGSIALVYLSTQAVADGHALVGTRAAGGVVVPAKSIPVGVSAVFAGEAGGQLMTASVSRTDNDLDIAFLKFSGPVSQPELQTAHSRRSAAIFDFLPKENGVPSGSNDAPPFASTVPFLIRINGADVGDGGVTLPVSRKVSRFDMEVVRAGATPVWQLKVALSSNPSVHFWNREKERGLNSVPTQELMYTHQALFRPIETGQFIKIPVEVSAIKQETYEWTLQITSKQDTFKKKIAVKFVSEK